MSPRLSNILILVALLLAACQPASGQPPIVPSPTPTIIALPTAIPQGDALHFGVIGNLNITNVWAYFDEHGADYNNRAAQAGFWPSLYALSPPDGTLGLFLAAQAFTPLQPEPTSITSTVTLRPGLTWSNGAPLTAEDVAFTVNTALEFRLGLDWHAAYNPALLDHAEALDAQTVKFHFKSQPFVEDWQYGALLGPVVNAAYWSPKLSGPRSLLPNPALEREIEDLQVQLQSLQKYMDELVAGLRGIEITSPAYKEQQTLIRKQQDAIGAAQAQIDAKQQELDSQFTAARTALYALDASGEPTFGPFMLFSRSNEEVVNTINPAYLFGAPHFTHVVYHAYPSEEAARAAFQAGDVNLVLSPRGLSADSSATAQVNALNNIRYLAFNLQNPVLADLSLRKAIACLVGGFAPADGLPADGLVPASNVVWRDPQVGLPCGASADVASRLAQAVTMLEAAGYGWTVRPGSDGAASAGSGLRRAGEAALPEVTMLVYPLDSDPQRLSDAQSVAERIGLLGLPVRLEQVTQVDAVYRVFETGQFDMVVLGWRLARYPSYLCDLFGADNPYRYTSDAVNQQCALFRSATDVDAARQAAFAIQSSLAADVPVVPLYSDAIRETLRRVAYPFTSVLDGYSGLYGAPWLAMPAP